MAVSPTRVAFIGAGGVNFGGHGNAWDHATRLEKMSDVIFVGAADIIVAQAERVVNIRRSGQYGSLWKDTRIFGDHKEMLREAKPDCVFIGLPPNCHGNDEKAVELDCVNAKVHAFIEKPISCTPPEELENFASTIAAAEETEGIVISVAYMLRYSSVMNKVKELINSFGPVKVFQARYQCAYSTLAKQFWWDIKNSGGPIVEQGTHFVDLARFFCGDADLSTIQALSIKANEPAGKLASIPIDESSIPDERRIPRVTSAIWKFKNGAVGTLMHSVLLHGWNYETQIEVSGDGYYICVRDPYDKCLISYRTPGSEEEKTLQLQDDPYKTEVEVFLNAIRSGDKTMIQSTFDDAFKTYELTWAIRRAAEGNTASSTPVVPARRGAALEAAE